GCYTVCGVGGLWPVAVALLGQRQPERVDPLGRREHLAHKECPWHTVPQTAITLPHGSFRCLQGAHGAAHDAWHRMTPSCVDGQLVVIEVERGGEVADHRIRITCGKRCEVKPALDELEDGHRLILLIIDDALPA